MYAYVCMLRRDSIAGIGRPVTGLDRIGCRTGARREGMSGPGLISRRTNTRRCQCSNALDLLHNGRMKTTRARQKATGQA